MNKILTLSTINLSRLVSAGLVLVILGILCFGIFWFQYSHQSELREIAKDPFSFPFLLAFLVFLYFLIIVIRAVHEPQYAMFLVGRLEEIIFLKKWGLTIGPLIVLGSLALGYFKEQWQIPVTLIGWAAGFYSVYVFIKDISGAWLRPIEREKYFLLETIKPKDVSHLISEDLNIKTPFGYNNIGPWRGRVLFVKDQSFLDEGFVTNPEVNNALQSFQSSLFKRRIAVNKDRKNFELNQELQDYKEVAITNVRAKGGLLYNEAKIRLAVDLCRVKNIDSEPIIIQKTNYYMSVCSNELAKFKISSRDSHDKVGVDMFKFVRSKDTGIVVNLDDSELSNHIGGGTLAITPGGKIIISKQGRLTVVASGLLAPSGSGSFDWSDFKKSSNIFGPLIQYGLERELKEECNFQRKDIKSTIILGMARDLARGGKPEFFAVTLLNRDVVNIRPEIQKNEIGFIDQHEFIDITSLSAKHLKEQIKTWLGDNRDRCSSALVMNIKLLLNANENTHVEILKHIIS